MSSSSSFLTSIQQKKRHLKPTSTITTHIDGRQFKEVPATSSTTNGPPPGPPEYIGSSQYGYVVDTKPDNVPAKITEHIYLGSQDCCCDLNILEQNNIHHVLSIGVEAPVKFDSVTYKFVDLLDLPHVDLLTCLRRECVPFLRLCCEDLDCNILVHCNAGVSRSSAIVIGYLILSRGLKYSEALRIVKKARSCAKPNIGFEKQLETL